VSKSEEKLTCTGRSLDWLDNKAQRASTKADLILMMASRFSGKIRETVMGYYGPEKQLCSRSSS
jgi:hypothetical protein